MCRPLKSMKLLGNSLSVRTSEIVITVSPNEIHGILEKHLVEKEFRDNIIFTQRNP